MVGDEFDVSDDSDADMADGDEDEPDAPGDDASDGGDVSGDGDERDGGQGGGADATAPDDKEAQDPALITSA